MGFLKRIVDANKVKTNRFGERLDRLTKDGKLPYGWIYENREFTVEREKEFRFFFDSWIAAEHEDIKTQYAAVKSLATYMENIKKICESKGECFAFWSATTVADPELLRNCKEKQQYIEDNINDLLKKERESKKLRAELLKMIIGTPGIMQADIYKHFAPMLKNDVQNELYRLSSNGTIARIKSGRSYRLYIK